MKLAEVTSDEYWEEERRTSAERHEQNHRQAEEHRQRLNDLPKHLKVDELHKMYKERGWAENKQGTISIPQWPDDLDLQFIDQDIKLPKDFHVYGSLWLAGSAIKKLPKGLNVGFIPGGYGNLSISNTTIKEIPEGVRVKGSLYATTCLHLEKISPDLHFEKTEFPQNSNVGFGNCKKLKSLPEGVFQISGIIDLRGSGVEQLPSDLKCDGLRLEDSKVLPYDVIGLKSVYRISYDDPDIDVMIQQFRKRFTRGERLAPLRAEMAEKMYELGLDEVYL